jgi:hypothetical protein
VAPKHELTGAENGCVQLSRSCIEMCDNGRQVLIHVVYGRIFKPFWDIYVSGVGLSWVQVYKEDIRYFRMLSTSRINIYLYLLHYSVIFNSLLDIIMTMHTNCDLICKILAMIFYVARARTYPLDYNDTVRVYMGRDLCLLYAI